MDEPSPLRGGAVSRLNQEAGFGYVDDDDSKHRFIFVFGHSIRHSQARGLSVGSRVRFRLAEGDRSKVVEVLPDPVQPVSSAPWTAAKAWRSALASTRAWWDSRRS